RALPKGSPGDRHDVPPLTSTDHRPIRSALSATEWHRANAGDIRDCSVPHSPDRWVPGDRHQPVARPILLGVTERGERIMKAGDGRRKRRRFSMTLCATPRRQLSVLHAAVTKMADDRAQQLLPRHGTATPPLAPK